MAKEEKATLKKGRSDFYLTGKAVVTEHTFKIDEKGKNDENWNYNGLSLGVDCGEKHGTIWTELMGGFGIGRDNVIYVHGKKEDGNDDFQNRYTIDWDDRLNEDVLEDIGRNCFITVGLKKDKDENTIYERFLSEYDVINYLKENLENGMIVNVKGKLVYNEYRGNIQCKKVINSIVLSKREEADFNATFTQTVLLDKDSLGEEDKVKNCIYLNTYVVDYVKQYNGKKLDLPKGKNGDNIALPITFEYHIDLSDKEKSEKIINKLLKVKKGVTEITFDGELIENGTLTQMTEDDLPDDIRELVELSVFTKEEAFAKCAGRTSKEKRMILKAPHINKNSDGVASLAITTEKYTVDDLVINVVDDDEEPSNAIEFNSAEMESLDTDVEADDELMAFLNDI